MHLLSPRVFIVTLEVLTRAIRQESKMKTYRLEKKKTVYLFEDGIIVFKVNPPKYLKNIYWNYQGVLQDCRTQFQYTIKYEI